MLKKSDAWNQDPSKMMMQPFQLTGGDKVSHDENIAADCTTVFCYSDSRCVYIQWFISQNWHMKHCMCGSVLIHTPQLFLTWLKLDKLIVIVILWWTLIGDSAGARITNCSGMIHCESCELRAIFMFRGRTRQLRNGSNMEFDYYTDRVSVEPFWIVQFLDTPQ